MTVKELIDELQKIENKELDVYVDIRNEVLWCGGEDLNDGIPYKYVEGVKLGEQINRNGPNTPCVILE